MSERGSFVTEYFYCKKCYEAVRAILLKREKFLCSVVIPTWEDNGESLPIIAGKIGGIYGGEELHTFVFELNEQISKVICHPVRIAVLAEHNQDIFFITPATEAKIEKETFHTPEELIPIEEKIEQLKVDIKHEEEKQKEIQSVITPPNMDKVEEWNAKEELEEQFNSIFTDGNEHWIVSPKIAFEWLLAKIRHEATR